MNISFDNATNFRKSLEARLKNIAIATGEDLQRLRRKVAFDRFLARLSLQEEPKFFLKGGYAMELRLSTARATKDIDLTCTSRAEEALIKVILLEDLRALSKKNLGDFFVYQVEEAQIDLDGAPYGGARYPVSSLIDGKLFVRFQLDVGADTVVTRLETLKGQDWLSFCGIPSLTFPAISIEQQFAEKLHAYTLPRLERKNSRVKDLIDMILLMRIRSLDLFVLKNALHLVFKIRKTHLLPQSLEPPPTEWYFSYAKLAKECAISSTLDETFLEITHLYSKIFNFK